MKKTIDLLESYIKNPSAGLPEEIFLLITKLTPMVNVDLLIKNEQNHTLLTWRDDSLYPACWHIPGGIIRYKETIADRIKAVAAGELGAEVEFKETPLAINELIHPARRVRGHFISFLYECKLMSAPDEKLRYKNGDPKPGEWAWHCKCPDNLISVHDIYRKYL